MAHETHGNTLVAAVHLFKNTVNHTNEERPRLGFRRVISTGTYPFGIEVHYSSGTWICHCSEKASEPNVFDFLGAPFYIGIID